MEKSGLVEEAWPLIRMWFFAQRAKRLPENQDLAFCYGMLNKVSRSFAVVIQQLPLQLRDSVCIFYLVLRALDTVEDDMSIPVATKVPILRQFYTHIYNREWRMQCGEKEYARLMECYPSVTRVFLRLPETHQKVIADITRRMGNGMADFIETDVNTVKDYDLYCHYVAGLVGVGLSQLFASSQLESQALAKNESLSNHMGLFLQKTNIIRDYLEDIEELPAPRMFWPKEIWGNYAKALEEFKQPGNSSNAVQALNDMIVNGLRHAQYSLEYMEALQDWDILRFCAIPQVMAFATLALVYNNPKVFTGVVKVKRGVVARYMVGLNSMSEVYRAFLHLATILAARCRSALKKKQERLTYTEWPDLTAFLTRMAFLGLLAGLLLQLTRPSGTLVQYIAVSPLLCLATFLIYSSSLRM